MELHRGPGRGGVKVPLSIVIPVLDEAAWLGAALAALPGGVGVEVVVVDGGSADGTADLARRFAPEAGARGLRLVVMEAERGRARQMNAGAARARGEVLLFLHADTLLPPGALPAIAAALARPEVVGGAFRHSFRERGVGLWLVSAASNLRARLWGTLYGDQAIFVRRRAFEALGGFRALPLFEDADLSRRMRRLGRTVLLPLRVRTSARRYLRGGVARTAWRMARWKLARLGGGDAGRMGRDYWDAAARGARPGGRE
jgi:rSAM/selenodomain-associated transferase 2